MFGKVLFWALAIAMLLHEIYQIIAGNASKAWRKHPAKATDVRIKARVNEGAEEYGPQIQYEYYYLGSRYKGKRVKFGNIWSTSYGKAGSVLRGVVTGSELTIYVNPKNPRQSVLVPGYDGSILLLVAFISVFIYAALKS